ncbi:hypothetical protein GC163_22765 [bacterium]|nr:hypothetical protein [bacterium]
MSATLVNCPQCQAELQPGMLRCRSCGARLPKTTASHSQPAASTEGASPASNGPAIPPTGKSTLPGGTAFQLDAMLAAPTPPAGTKPVPQPASPSQETGRSARPAIPSTTATTHPESRGLRPSAKSSNASGILSSVSAVIELPAEAKQESDDTASQRIAVQCACQARFRVKAELAGRKIKCPKCQQSVVVPTIEPQPAVTASGRFLVPSDPQGKSFADFAEILEKQPPLVNEPIEHKPHLSQRKLKKFTESIQKKNAEGKPEAELRAQAIREFGKTADARVLELLVPLVSDYWISIREAVAEVLGELHDPAATPHLVRLLDDEVPDVKRDAVIALGKIGDARAVPALLNLALQEPLYRFTAGETIVRIGKLAVPVLMEILKSDDPGLVLEAVVVLGRIRDASATDSLAAMLGHRFGIIRSHAAEALGNIGDPKGATALIHVLGDPDAVVRANAAAALQRLGDKRAVKPLMKLLSDEDADVCSRAAATLGELGDAQATPALLPLLQHSEANVRAAAAEALGRLGDELAAEPLTQLFYDEDENTRLKAVSAFRRFRSASAVAPLLQLLDDNNVAIRQRAVDALGEMGNLAALERLIVTLKTDTAVEVRMAAAKALGLLRSPKALPVLEEALDDELTVRCRCISALGDIGDASTLPALLAMLRDTTPEVRYHASQALAEIGHQNSRKPLEDLLSDENLMVRRGAAKALVKLGDPRGDQLIELVSAKPKLSAQARMAALVPDWLVGLVNPASAGGQLVIILLVGLPLLGAFGYFVGPSILNMFKPAQRLTIRGKPSSVGISTDGQIMLTGRSRGSAEVWDIAKNSRIEEIVFPTNVGVSGMAMSPDGKLILISAGEQLFKYVNQELQPLPSHPSTIRNLLVSQDGVRAATYSNDGTVYVIKLDTGEIEASLLLNAPEMEIFNFSNDGSLVAWGTSKGTVSVFDVKASSVIAEFKLGTELIRALAFSPDNQTLVASGPPLRAICWDLNTKKVALKVELDDPNQQYYDWFSFSADGTKIIAVSGRQIDLVDPTTGEKTTISIPEIAPIDIVAMDTKGERLVMASQEESPVWVVDLVGQKLLGTFDRK